MGGFEGEQGLRDEGVGVFGEGLGVKGFGGGFWGGGGLFAGDGDAGPVGEGGLCGGSRRGEKEAAEGEVADAHVDAYEVVGFVFFSCCCCCCFPLDAAMFETPIQGYRFGELIEYRRA